MIDPMGVIMLKIALFGGTGRVGQAFLNFVEEDGRYSVYALVRRTEGARIPDKCCQALTGNARNQHDVESLIKDSDIVVSCLNTDGDDTLTVSIEHMINAMNAHRIKRLITIGTAGILNARQNPDLYRFETNESKRRSARAAQEHARVYERLRESELDWTIVCPTYLPDGPALKTYRFEQDVLPDGGKEISTGDTAHFLFKQLESDQFVKARVGLAY
ncbi:NAD(P)H-binding protein [Bacillus paralicheniformis]|jgi:putative NADH-flavin reductase|nr:NAD(P)H-binding protein [Bacillus paralicheniformis]MBC8624011.1 NAD(P)H-binding protein [Robertmurraya crescens]ARA84950.1 hypothetical protein BLMD_05620 [Bacillus paralicheniformis]AYQ15615.1 hypothetical protein D5285_05835 [Bacillus paralicheniformis]KFM89651.1 semialdehyde dehydrogenase, NAD binding domain protein [Bacillus paralicheniformis]MBL7476980.1 NAD(P)H-binding protein [Bacillus paralicheniformis]